MPDDLKPMIKIGNVTPPQYLNEQGDWELVRGAGGAYRMQESVEVSDEPFGGSGNLTKEFTSEMSGLVISNDSVPGAVGAADLTFTIDGKTRTVKAGEVYEGKFKPFTAVTVNSTVPWRAEGLQTIGGTMVQPPADTIAPDNVTNLTTSNLTATSLTLTWVASASSDCTGYDVYRGSTLLTSVTGTSYNVSGLTQATQYTFTVKAKDAANNIASGTQTTVTTSSSADTTPPTNVTNLTTANITQTGLTLNWTASASSDVASYDVYNGTTFLSNVTGTTYNVNGLAASTAYTFWVKAKDASGNAASGTSVDATTSAPAADTTAPSNVTNLTTSGLTQTGVTLNWTAATDNVAVTGYEVYNGASLVTTVTGTTYNVTGLTASTEYTFTVKAKDAANNVASGTSVTFTTTAAADTTPPNPVTGLTAGTVTSSSVPLTWTLSSSGDVANQEVAYSSNGGTSYTVASGVINPSSNSYTVTGLAANQAYTFRVVAIDGALNRSTAVTTTATTAAGADTTPPEVVTNLATGTPTASTVPLTWTASVASDIAHYEVAYSTDGTNFTIANAAVTGASYTVAGLTASTLYTFRVASIDTSNNRSSSNPTVQATTLAAAGKVNDASLILYQDNPTLNQTIPNPDNYFQTNTLWTAFATVKPILNTNPATFIFSRMSTNAMKFEFTYDNHFKCTLYGHVTNGTGAAAFPAAVDPAVRTDLTGYYHVAIVRDATKLYLYVDNVMVISVNVASDMYIDASTAPLLFGSHSQPSPPLFKNMGYYNRALTTSELTQNYNALK